MKILNLHYDVKADVLYLWFDNPRAALGEDIGNGIILRRDPETNKVVGATIVSFAKQFTDHPDITLGVPLWKSSR